VAFPATPQQTLKPSRAVVPDNPKTVVIHACRYEPVLH
jgi:hypothetical protein